VRTELYQLRHRLRALGLLGPDATGTDRDPGREGLLPLTEAGVNAALSALLARALRPRHHLGIG
jgi:hypothetical protein